MMKVPKKFITAKKPVNGPEIPPRPRFRCLNIFVLGVGVTILAQLLVFALGGGGWVKTGGQSDAPRAAVGLPVNPPGRWGQLEYTEVMLDRPDESFPVTPPPLREIRWFFKDHSREQLAALIGSCDLTGSQQALLLEPARGAARPGGFFLVPPPEVVRDMSTAARRKIYSVLAGSDANHYQRHPFRFHGGHLEERLALSKLSPASIQLIQKLTYPEGEATCFADSQLLEHLLPPAELKPSAELLSQTKTFLMKLRISSASDISALAKYWGRAGRGQAIRTMLKSMSHVPGGASISVAYFLPPFPRLRLHTYPDPALDRTPKAPDCFWTAMNFFNKEPDHRFFDPDHTRKVLATEYDRVSGGWVFGDLIMLQDEERFAQHMCVYVADGVVFTKNGAGPLQPWVLQKLSEMIAQYPSEKPLHQAGYRRKAALL